MEFDTWVPYVKDHVPRPIVFGTVILLVAASIHYQGWSAAFYLGLIVGGNALLWKVEQWTAVRDRKAVAAGVPTRGWGVDPSKPLLDRFHVQQEVDAKATQAEQ